MPAYYNELDPYAAQWLRNLIDAGHIAPGVVDTRSIEDVRPDELREFTQCHFFAGIGVWSYALRLADWPDDRPVWTGSCPCQPFSAAGQGAGFTDERHLWPAWHYHIEECRPAVVFGEQVEAAIKHGWLDLVQSDLEGSGYAFGASGIPAAGVGAPHIRQRLFFVADAESSRRARQLLRTGSRLPSDGTAQNCDVVELADADGRDARAEGLQRSGQHGQQPQDGRAGSLADSIMQQRQAGQTRIGAIDDAPGRIEGAAEAAGFRSDLWPSPTNGFWRDADWLFCRDGRWRPIESGIKPLVNGASARVGRLRAYGNAIVAQAAAEFIKASMTD